MSVSLSTKETKAFEAIIKNALSAMGGKQPQDLHHDNHSWFNITTITEVGFSSFEAAGLMSSLETKGIICNAEPEHRWGWCVEEEAIDLAQTLFGN